MKIRHTQIEAFRAVMTTGSITNAAAMLNKSQPSVTRFIHDLEHAIGYSLFHRQGGRIFPTEEAKVFYKEVERSFTGLMQLEKTAREIGQLRTMRLPLATIPAPMLEVIPQTVQRLNSSGRQAAVNAIVHASPRVVERVRSEQVVLGLCNLQQAEPGVSIIRKYSFPYCLVMLPDHPLAELQSVSLDALSEHPFISLGEEHFAAQGTDPESLAKLRAATVIETELCYSVCCFALQGLGVAIADPLTARFFSTKGLVSRTLQTLIPYDLALIEPAFTYRGRGVDQVIDHMDALLAEAVA